MVTLTSHPLRRVNVFRALRLAFLRMVEYVLLKSLGGQAAPEFEGRGHN